MIIDRLYDEINSKSFVCVGLDTSYDYIPDKFKTGDVKKDVFNFNKEIIDATKDLVAIFKLQIAFYEAMGIEGMKAYYMTMKYLKDNGLLSIGDIKRGDIASTAKEYAKAHFEGEFAADFITVNPYMGFDTLEHFYPYLEKGTNGIFVLLRTSNPGAKDIEYLNYNGEPLYYHVGDQLEKLGKQFIGKNGISALSMVVGGTHSEEAVEIRNRYKDTLFLIPGYGAQGGKAKDISIYLGSENKGIVNSSRGIILAYKKEDKGEDNIGLCARNAVINMREDIWSYQNTNL